MRRILPTVLLALVVAACAADPNDEQAFQSYVSEFHLEALSVSTAADRLRAAGFSCNQTRGSAEGFAITCERKVGGFPCARWYFVGLAFAADNPGTSAVTPRFGHVCP